MTEAEAKQLAQEEGLSLTPADNATGYRGVYPSASCTSFCVIINPKIKRQYLGSFSSAAEAALAYARHLGPEGCAGMRSVGGRALGGEMNW